MPAASNTAPAARRTPLGEWLYRRGQLSRAQLAQVLSRQRAEPGRRFGELAAGLGYIDGEQLRAALSARLNIAEVEPDKVTVDGAALNRLPPELARRERLLPLGYRDGRLQVAMADPLDENALALLRFYFSCPIEPLRADPQTLQTVLERQQLNRAADRAAASQHAAEPTGPAAGPRPQHQPLVRLLDALLTQAVGARASDINIRPGERELAVYFRVDGRQRLFRTLPRSLLAPLINRLKILGAMDIANRRLPQDGQTRLRCAGRDVDLRLSILPTVNGESASIRILDKTAGFRPLTEIGFAESDYHRLRRLLAAGSGLLLVTGPTGAGKSTTLYALLDHIKQRQPHVITLEEPVEYRMEGVEQLAVRNATGMTFARALRSVLRHDPDVILVGEIRDAETAQIATRAALTGHLVLSSLHTNDAASAATRLLDLGVESYLLGSTLLGVVAQRLLALNCPHCVAGESLSDRERSALGLGTGELCRRGAGCERCEGRGVAGRAVAYELLPVDTAVRALIHTRRDAYAIRQAAAEAGMRTLHEHALSLVRAGRVPAAELALSRPQLW